MATPPIFALLSRDSPTTIIRGSVLFVNSPLLKCALKHDSTVLFLHVDDYDILCVYIQFMRYYGNMRLINIYIK